MAEAGRILSLVSFAFVLFLFFFILKILVLFVCFRIVVVVVVVELHFFVFNLYLFFSFDSLLASAKNRAKLSRSVFRVVPSSTSKLDCGNWLCDMIKIKEKIKINHMSIPYSAAHASSSLSSFGLARC